MVIQKIKQFPPEKLAKIADYIEFIEYQDHPKQNDQSMEATQDVFFTLAGVGDGNNLTHYTVIIERELEGGYHGYCPALKGCHTQGETFEETIENITEAISLYVESLIADNQPIPQEDLIVKPLTIRI